MNKITKLGKDTYSHYDNDTGEIFVFGVEGYKGLVIAAEYKAVKTHLGLPVATSGYYTNKKALINAIECGSCIWEKISKQSKTRNPHEGARKIREEWKTWKELDNKWDDFIVDAMCGSHEKLFGKKSKSEYDDLILSCELFKLKIIDLKAEIERKDKKIKDLEDKLDNIGAFFDFSDIQEKIIKDLKYQLSCRKNTEQNWSGLARKSKDARRKARILKNSQASLKNCFEESLKEFNKLCDTVLKW